MKFRKSIEQSGFFDLIDRLQELSSRAPLKFEVESSSVKIQLSASQQQPGRRVISVRSTLLVYQCKQKRTRVSEALDLSFLVEQRRGLDHSTRRHRLLSCDMRFNLNSGIGATFHQAFNKDIYDLDAGDHVKGGHPP